MWFFTVLIVVQIVSILFCMATVKRLYDYISEYRFGESVYTLLFGFVHLRYFVYLYIFTVAGVATLGFLFAFSSPSP